MVLNVRHDADTGSADYETTPGSAPCESGRTGRQDQGDVHDGKVVVRLRGGIGNQLFCYAAARRLALANDAELVLDHLSGYRKRQIQRAYKLHHFHVDARFATARERMDGLARLRRFWLRLAARIRPFPRGAYVLERGMAFDPRLLTRRVHGTVYLNGLWQSEKYFADIADILRRDLRMHGPSDALNRKMASEIRAHGALAVHVRSFREAAHPKGPLKRLASYYANAIELAMRRCGQRRMYVFSDDPDLARRLIEPIGPPAVFVTHNHTAGFAHADLWLMSLCRHFVIADSTFSWWGAWLGENRDTFVIAPGRGLLSPPGVWGLPGQLPRRWVAL